MLKQYVKHVWYNLTDLEIASVMDFTVTKMTGNVNFSTPTVSMIIMTKASKRLRDAWANRKSGPEAELELYNAEVAAVGLLNLQAGYVDGLALGVATLILNAGFEATSGERVESVIPDQPETPSVKVFPGKLGLRVKPIVNATRAIWVIFTAAVFEIKVENNTIILPPNSGVILIPIGGLLETVSGLAPKMAVSIGVFGYSPAGVGVMSTLQTATTI